MFFHTISRKVCTKWKHLYLIEVWSLWGLLPHTSGRYKGKIVSENRGWAFEKHVKSNFQLSQFLSNIMWLILVFLVASEAGGTNPQSQCPTVRRYENGRPVSRWESLQLSECEAGFGHRISDTPLLASTSLVRQREEYWGAAKGRSWAVHRFASYLNTRE